MEHFYTLWFTKNTLLLSTFTKRGVVTSWLAERETPPQLITLIDPPAHRWSGSKWPSDTSGWTTPDVLIRDRTGSSQRSGPLPETRARILILILTFNSLHMSDTSRTDLDMGEWTCTSPFLINISFFTRCLFSLTAVCRLVCTHIDWLSD